MRMVNPGLDADHPDLVPIDVDVEIHRSWDGE
jgi:hypothetical protein